ncbi:MAG: hypothetical protein SR3Q1_00725 [Quinella sp. 3Q1]|nr:hypothetical protein [Quinella sp. 3Q1]
MTPQKKPAEFRQAELEEYLSLEFVDDLAENLQQVVGARLDISCLERTNCAVSGRILEALTREKSFMTPQKKPAEFRQAELEEYLSLELWTI